MGSRGNVRATYCGAYGQSVTYRSYEGKTTTNAIIMDRVSRLVEDHGKYSAQIYIRPEGAKTLSARVW